MASKTAILMIDPLNDFIHPSGKLYSSLKESLEATDSVKNLIKLTQGARELKIPIFYGLHQPFRDGCYDGWNHMKESHHILQKLEVFKENTWGGEVYADLQPEKRNGDVIVSRHWNSSSFSNTDLDYQLRQRDITHVVCAGMVANTCVETTARYASELGYKVTIIKDATAGFTSQLKDVAAEIIWPTIVEEVCTVEEWLARENDRLK